MAVAILRSIRTAAVSGLATMALLVIANRTARAEKANPECRNNTTSLCQQVETCSGGFEPNGTCKYVYSVLRYYWRY